MNNNTAGYPVDAPPDRRPILALALATYVPLLLTAPGRVGADTKQYLYLDPSRLLSRAWSMWDPDVGLGTVSHQTIGYLWPMGPWYWVFDRLGVPDWVAQRLWLATILFAAGAGVLWLLRSVFGWRTAPATVAAFAYTCTPYVLTLAARLSAILLPYAGLPWLIGLTVLSARQRGWRHPAAFALVVATVGSVNATALLLVGLAPAWWLVHAVTTREIPVRRAAGAAARIGVLTLAANAWWIAGLWAQGGWGIDILRYTETAEVVASASNGAEVLRGLGYWFFYGGDRLGPWIEPSVSYTQRLPLLVLTFALPLLALTAACRVRFRERSFFVGLLAIGTVVAVGAHPWDDPPPGGEAIKAFLLSDVGLAMRSLPRAVPLIALALAACLGIGADALAAWWAARAVDLKLPSSRAATRRAIVVPVAAVALAYLAIPPLWTGGMVAENLDRPSEVPAYWDEVAAHLDEGDENARVLEVPGADFASYRWGNTVDPITPGMTDRAYAARELIPYGTPAAADLLSALDRRLQEGTLEPGTLAVVARYLGVDEIVLRDDLQFERYRTPRPYQLAPYLAADEGLGAPLGFGEPAVNEPIDDVPLLDEQALALDDQAARPPVEVFGVEGAEPIVRTRPSGGGVVLAGDGEGLVDAAAAGVLSGHELVRYAASLGVEGVADALRSGATIVITDGNREQGRRWSTVRDVLGYVEPLPVLVDDLTDNRLPVFPNAEDGWTTRARGGVLTVATSSYGNSITFTPEYRPAMAADGDPTTEWRTGGSSDVRGERIELRPATATTATELRVVQAQGGSPSRSITEVLLRVNDGAAVPVALDERSLGAEGQRVPLSPDGTPVAVEGVSLEITAESSGRVPTWGRPVRWNGLRHVGFAELELLGPASSPVTDATLVLPPAAGDALATAGDAPVALVLTRWRTEATNPERRDPEAVLVREWSQPAAATFELSGRARLSPRAADAVLAGALGTGGPRVEATSRLTGVPAALAAAALDGDPATWWSPAFEDAAPSLLVTSPVPVTVAALAPVVLDDGRRSVPTELHVEADGVAVGTVPIAGDGTPVSLPAPVTASQFRFSITAVEPRTTTDWFSDAEVTVPVAIAELGIAPLATTIPDRLDTGCRDDLLDLDGESVPVRIAGPTAALLAGSAVALQPCGSGSTEVGIASGTHRLVGRSGAASGFDVDQVVLQTGQPAPAVTEAPPVSIVRDERYRYRLEITGATADEPFWLVLGQSFSSGWRLDGESSELVDGYANGWLVTPTSETIRLDLVWEPQEVVSMALAASAVGALGCLLIAGLPGLMRRLGVEKRARRPDAPPPPPAARPASSRWRAAVVATAGVGSILFIGPVAAVVVVAISAGSAWGGPSARRLLVWAPVVAYAAASAYIVTRQAVARPTAAFEWPAEQATAHQPALVAVALLCVVVALQSRPAEE